MKNISVIVDRGNDAESMLSAMLNSELKSKDFPHPVKSGNIGTQASKIKEPRAVFLMNNGASESLIVKIYCIQDFIDSNKSAVSNSREQLRVLPDMIQNSTDLVIAVGTATNPDEPSSDGSIVIGGNFFIYDAHAGNSKGYPAHPGFGQMLPCNVNAGIFNLIDKDFKKQVEPKFLQAPGNSAKPATCKASCIYAAVSTVNIAGHSDYNRAGYDAIAHFKQMGSMLPVKSLETTHGLIKLSTEKPVLFVSAITHRPEYFDAEGAAPQNHSRSFNTGIFMSHYLVALNEYFLSEGSVGI